MSELYRTCPKCGHQWHGRGQWEADTHVVGQETQQHTKRRKRFGESCEVVVSVLVTVRRHSGCGGEMLSEGAVVGERVLG